jgi:hypothetical protein
VRPRQYERPPIWKHYKAVVSRGGRPDMALSAYTSSNSTHFITSRWNGCSRNWNEQMAFDELQSVKEMKITRSYTSFEEPES